MEFYYISWYMLMKMLPKRTDRCFLLGLERWLVDKNASSSFRGPELSSQYPCWMVYLQPQFQGPNAHFWSLKAPVLG